MRPRLSRGRADDGSCRSKGHSRCVKAGRWRILVGDDAHRLDERVRRAPEQAYDAEFYRNFAEEAGWRQG
jgi:hypothetical protein